jgi:hypothetical protein
LIAHTQPGSGAAAVHASVADEAALTRLGQKSSVIIDEAGTTATRFRATEEGAALAKAQVGEPIIANAPRAAGRVAIEVTVEQAQINAVKFSEIAAERAARRPPIASAASATGTMARLEINGEALYGVNSGLQGSYQGSYGGGVTVGELR